MLAGMGGINALIVGCALAMACRSFLKRPRTRALSATLIFDSVQLKRTPTKSKADASAPEPAPSQPPIDLTTVSEVEHQLDSRGQGKQTPVNDRLPQYDIVATEAAAPGSHGVDEHHWRADAHLAQPTPCRQLSHFGQLQVRVRSLL